MSVHANCHYVSFSPQMLWFLINEINSLELRCLTCTLAVSLCQSWAALLLLDSQMAQWLIVRGRFWELKSSTPPWTLGCLLLVYFGKGPERHLLSKIFEDFCVFEAHLRQTQCSCEVYRLQAISINKVKPTQECPDVPLYVSSHRSLSQDSQLVQSLGTFFSSCAEGVGATFSKCHTNRPLNGKAPDWCSLHCYLCEKNLRSHRYSQTRGTICPPHPTHTSISKEAHKTGMLENKEATAVYLLSTYREWKWSYVSAVVCVFRRQDALNELNLSSEALRTNRYGNERAGGHKKFEKLRLNPWFSSTGHDTQSRQTPQRPAWGRLYLCIRLSLRRTHK